MIKLTALTDEHIEEAALLVRLHYQQLCQKEPNLPPRYTQVNSLIPLLQDILRATESSVAATRGNQLVGFITAWQMPSFRGLKSTYSPEWANAAIEEDRRRIYQEMYAHISHQWISENYVAHYISMFPHDRKVLDTWHWLGFGMISVDGIRSLAPLPGCNWTGQIRRAEMHDLEHVLALSDDLWHFMQTSPTFLLSPRRDRNYYEEWLQNPEKLVWLAYEQGAPVAFLQLGPADPDVCTIIQDESTTSIYAAFTKENVRGTGITTALLGHALRTARESGYTRCAVSFEPMNTVASRFWLKYFNPACYSVFRHIDERVIPT